MILSFIRLLKWLLSYERWNEDVESGMDPVITITTGILQGLI